MSNVENQELKAPQVVAIDSLYIPSPYSDELLDDGQISSNDTTSQNTKIAEMYKANRKVNVKEKKLPFPIRVPFSMEPHCTYYLKHKETVETITISQYIAYKANESIQNGTSRPIKITKRKNKITRTRNQVFVVRESNLGQYMLQNSANSNNSNQQQQNEMFNWQFNLPPINSLGIATTTNPLATNPTLSNNNNSNTGQLSPFLIPEQSQRHCPMLSAQNFYSIFPYSQYQM